MATPPGTLALAIWPTRVPRAIMACTWLSSSSSGAPGSCAIHHRSFWHCSPAMTRDFERPGRRNSGALTLLRLDQLQANTGKFWEQVAVINHGDADIIGLGNMFME